MKIPPPSPALEQALAEMKPVALRKPWRGVLCVFAVSLLPALVLLFMLPKRPDLPRLSPAWVVAMAAWWSLAFMVPLVLALVPPRRAVLPDAGRSLRIAWVTLVLVLASQVLGTHKAPGYTLEGMGHVLCFPIGLVLACVPLLASAWVLRRAMPLGGFRLGAAVGVAGASLGGFVLHWLCPYGSALHTGLWHGGAVAGGLVLGLLAGALAARTRWFV